MTDLNGAMCEHAECAYSGVAAMIQGCSGCGHAKYEHLSTSRHRCTARKCRCYSFKSKGKGTKMEISDRCPCCGGQTLFIGTGGWITCSAKWCKSVGLSKNIEELKAELALVSERALKAESAIDRVRGFMFERDERRKKQQEWDESLARRTEAKEAEQ